MIITCSKCGYIPKTEAKFCEICGKQFTDEDRAPFLMTGKTVEIPFPLKEEKMLRAHYPTFYQKIKGVTTTEIFGWIFGCLYLTDKNLVFCTCRRAHNLIPMAKLISMAKLPFEFGSVDFSIPLNKISSVDIIRIGFLVQVSHLQIDYECEDRMESKVVLLLCIVPYASHIRRQGRKKAFEFYTNYVLPGWKTAIQEAAKNAKKAPSETKEKFDAKEKLELLEGRLLKGEISEETYKELKKKYEQG